MRHFQVLLAMVLTIVVLSSPASAEDDNTRRYCRSQGHRIVNMYAVQEDLTLDKVTGTIVRVSAALKYIESHRPEYLEAHPNFHDWMQTLANMDGLAVQIEAPGLTFDSFYIPEPFDVDEPEGDVPFVHNGLLVDLSSDPTKQSGDCFGYEVGPDECFFITGTSSCRPCPDDPDHPLFDLDREDQSVMIREKYLGEKMTIR